MYQIKFDIVTDESGDYDSTADATVLHQANVLEFFEGPLLLHAVEWVDGDLADGVDAVLSMTNTLSGVDKTLLTLTNADNDAWHYPRALAQGVDGANLTGVYVRQIVEGTLKLVVAAGGNAKTGKCIVYLVCPESYD